MTEYYRAKLYGFGATRARKRIYAASSLRFQPGKQSIASNAKREENTMKKKNAFAPNAAKAVALLSLLLVASAVFLSQTDKLFAQAASSNIRGTFILMDKSISNTNSYTVIKNVTTPVALPGSTCTVVVAACTSGNFEAPGLKYDLQAFPPSAGGGCTQTPPTASTGGIHMVSAGIHASSFYNIHHLSVAYDCTP